MNFPVTLQYTKSHEWVKTLEDGKLEMGLTDYAQKELGSLVFINLPLVGDQVCAGDNIADVESVKSVSDVYAPATGTIVEVNEELLDNPGGVNEDPYGAWFVRMEGVSDTEELLDAAAYEAFTQAEKAGH